MLLSFLLLINIALVVFNIAFIAFPKIFDPIYGAFNRFNGPVGIDEVHRFAAGTGMIVQLILCTFYAFLVSTIVGLL